ncbi:MAG: winged helix-turn-helix transcriptional regulator [Alphaproteobacteria bacterium]|nr:winged helix-turn-helix transcriptional regulator [Alphaproteobacteria bacterium]
MNVDFEKLEENVKAASRLLKALSNEKRLMIICSLYEQELCVGDIEKLVNLSQSALSQHLARLRRDGFVKTRRDAQTIYYSLNDPATRSVLECLYNYYCKDCLSKGC